MCSSVYVAMMIKYIKVLQFYYDENKFLTAMIYSLLGDEKDKTKFYIRYDIKYYLIWTLEHIYILRFS